MTNNKLDAKRRDSARKYLAEKYDKQRPEGFKKLSECEALIELLAQGGKVEASNGLHLDKTSHEVVMAVLMLLLPGFPNDSKDLVWLRSWVDKTKEARAQKLEAINHLRSAAKLLGLRESFFISIDSPERRDARLKPFADIKRREGMTEEEIERNWPFWITAIRKLSAPSVEGETDAEFEKRDALCHLLHYIDDEYPWERMAKFDRRTGKGGSVLGPSPAPMAFRVLWDAWPELLKQTSGDWEPNKIAREILLYCGHDLSSVDIAKYKDAIKRQSINSMRRSHEVP